MERIAHKKLPSSKKLFRVSSEVHSVLQRKHDKWSLLRAYDRLKKDLHIFHVMCKVLLSFLLNLEQSLMKMLLVMGRQSRCFHIWSGNVLMMTILCQVSKKLNFLGVRILISCIFFLQSLHRIISNMGVSHPFL